MRCWKVYCMEEKYSGLWYTWFRDQVATVGWPPDDFQLEGGTGGHGWGAARNYLQEVTTGDSLVVQLSGSRVGRLATVTGKRIADSEWEPTVPKSSDLPLGEQGRRIEVRWDLSFGEINPQYVSELPLEVRFSAGAELRWSTTRSMRVNSPRSRRLCETRRIGSHLYEASGTKRRYQITSLPRHIS